MSSPQITAVEASAGSGKTTQLAKNYLKILLGSDNPTAFRNILAVTFTNKAANEMKGRVLKYLKLLEFGEIPRELEDIPDNTNADKGRPSRIIEAIFDRYDNFRVQTIDSFVKSIINACAMLTEHTGSFDVRHDHKDFIAYSLDDLIDSYENDTEVRKVIRKFLDQYIYIENKTSWFPKKDIFDVVSDMFEMSNIYGKPYAKIEPKRKLYEVKKSILSLCKRLLNMLPKGTNKRFESALSKFVSGSDDGFSIGDISNYFTHEGFPVNRDADVPQDVTDLWERIRKEIKELCETEAFSSFNPYVDIYDMVMKNLSKRSSDNDLVFLEELNKRACAVRQMVDVPEMYYRLATRFDNYLIDEFQDTSVLQWNNIYALVEEALSRGGSLFYVGDKKQSIYRFRGARPALFDDITKQLGRFHSKAETLKINYRSAKEVVEAVNSVFSPDNLRKFISEYSGKNPYAEGFLPEVLELFANVEQDCHNKEEAGFVSVETVKVEDGEDQEETIGARFKQIVSDLKGRYLPKEIAVLCRENSEVALTSRWLSELSLPVDSASTTRLDEDPHIKELVAFLKFLTSPIDNVAFAAFISGDIFRKVSGISAEEVHSMMFDWARQRSEAFLYKYFRGRYELFWNRFIDRHFSTVDFVPVYEFILKIMNEFNLSSNIPESMPYMTGLLEVVLEKESDHPSLRSFIEYLETTDEKIYVNHGKSESVKVMTVHKAKGLEFPVVIMPFMNMDVTAGSGKRSGAVMEDEDNIYFVRLNKDYNHYSKAVEKVYVAELKRSFFDELNVVYVAMTRAAKELYVLVPPKAGRSVNPATFLLPESLVSGKKEASQKKAEPRPSPGARFIPGDIVELLKNDQYIKDATVVDRKKKTDGDMVHFILSFISKTTKNGLKDDLERAVGLACSKYQKDELLRVKHVAEKILLNKDCSSFFFVKDADVHTEKEIVLRDGRSVRLDRLIVTPEEAVVVDYKSSSERHEMYGEQIKGYISVLKSIYPDKKIRGFLLYSDLQSPEEVHE